MEALALNQTIARVKTVLQALIVHKGSVPALTVPMEEHVSSLFWEYQIASVLLGSLVLSAL